MDCSTPGFLSFTVSQGLLKLMSIESVMPSNLLILCCHLLLLPSIFRSLIVFSSESALHQMAKVLELQLQHMFPNFTFIHTHTDHLQMLVHSCG